MTEMNFRHLRYFQAVAHEGNLTRAAQRLHVSQSAVSTQIRELETRLGQELFERRGRGLLLTEAGRIALDYADAIFANARELLTTLQQSGHQRRVVRIGSQAILSRNFQLVFLRPILGRPDVEVILRSGSAAELLNGLSAHHLDLVLTNQPPPSDSLTQFTVHRLDEQAVSLIGVPALCPPALSLSERLERSPLILPTTASGLRMGFDALADRLGVRPQVAAEVDDMAMMRLLAREGVGLAVLPPVVVRDELANGVLIEGVQLSELTETFFGITAVRRFPNTLLKELLRDS
jgi:LysR family transcriptional activator of nhaA